MQPHVFAAQRAARLRSGDDYLRPVVREALQDYLAGDAEWSDRIVDAAAQIWLENFQAEAPGRPFQRPRDRFRAGLADTLDHTLAPEDEVSDAQIDRITRWLSTYATNAGTATGAFGRGVKFKRWTTMADEKVRDAHEALEGVVRPLGGTFPVDGAKLAFPGEPVGPPSGWINCRCVLMPASREGEAMSANTYTIGPDDQIDDDNPDVVEGYDAFASDPSGGRGIVPPQLDPRGDPGDIAVEPADEDDDDEELITEIPVHGVLAPEGVETGDAREFAIGSLSTRELPVPLRYEFEGTHGGDNSRVATVGRVDEAWRDDASNMWRWRGAIVLNRAYAQEVIDGLVDGTIRGVSIDGDNAQVELPDVDDETAVLEAMLGGGREVYTQMRTAGLTIVPIPAFQEAYIALGHDFQEDLTDDEREAQVAALQACGCLDGWGVVDVTESPLSNARAAIEAALLEDAFKDYDAATRKKMADAGTAMPDGSFPIADEEDLRNAIQSIGRASDPDAARAHIRKRARALGKENLIPEDWADSGETLSSQGFITASNIANSAAPRTWESATLATTTTANFAPGTHDGPGWITDPIPTARIRRYWTHGEGALKIRWGAPGDFNRCRKQLAKYVQNPDWLAGLCANMHFEALGFWPAQHHGSRVITAAGSTLASPAARLVKPEGSVFPAEWFQNPGLDRPQPLRIDKTTRRIYGYAAEWGVCHVGIDGFCQEVPPSFSDYGYFKKGLIDTDQGEQAVGIISYGVGHADRFARIAAATAHYDQPSAVRAYVNIGEDTRGIWFAGVLAPWVTDEDIDAMRAIGAVSGDWREIRGQYELIGIPVVNTPGFPVLAASAGRQITMIGVGRLTPEPDQDTSQDMSQDTDAIVQRAVTAAMRQHKLAARAETARATVRAQRLATARARIERS